MRFCDAEQRSLAEKLHRISKDVGGCCAREGVWRRRREGEVLGCELEILGVLLRRWGGVGGDGGGGDEGGRGEGRGDGGEERGGEGGGWVSVGDQRVLGKGVGEDEGGASRGMRPRIQIVSARGKSYEHASVVDEGDDEGKEGSHDEGNDSEFHEDEESRGARETDREGRRERQGRWVCGGVRKG